MVAKKQSKKLLVKEETKNTNTYQSKDVIAAFLMIVGISVVVFFYGSSVTGQVVGNMKSTTNSLFTFVFFMVGITLFFYMKSFPTTLKK